MNDKPRNTNYLSNLGERYLQPGLVESIDRLLSLSFGLIHDEPISLALARLLIDDGL